MWYRTGTVAVTSGSALVTGTGTLWSINTHPGDALTFDGTAFYEIDHLDASTPDTKFYLKSNFPGATASGLSYAVIPLSQLSLTAAGLAQQVSSLLNGWQVRETEFTAWQGGSATAGYDITGTAATGSTAGYYPLTDALGTAHYLACPAKLAILAAADTVDTFHASQTPAANQIPVVKSDSTLALPGAVTAPTPASTDYTTKLATTVFVKDALRAQLEGTTGGQCTVLYDSAGNPNFMRIIPAFCGYDISPNLGSAGVPFPAFFVNGVFKPQIFYPMYPAVNVSGLACSLPNAAPWTSINFDDAKAACTAKGTGWHMSTNWEWAALALWCIKNGNPLLRGNTYYGQAYDKPFETGRRTDGGQPGNTSGAASILNGSGPASWRHDGSMAGISDLVGNIWEWQDGFKVVDGVIKMPTDNYYGLAEASWPDTLARIDGSGSASVISDIITSRNSGLSNTWSATTIKGGYTPPLILKQALICPYDTAANMGNVSGNLWVNNSTSFEALPFRGGNWIDPSICGLAALNLSYQRSLAGGSVGFRPTFIA